MPTSASPAPAKSQAARCAHVKADGSPCLGWPGKGSLFCFAHDPALAGQRAAARHKGGKNRRAVRAVRYLPGEQPPVSLQSVTDVLAVLESELGIVLQMEPSISRARTVIAACATAIKILEVTELAARLTAVEARLSIPERAA